MLLRPSSHIFKAFMSHFWGFPVFLLGPSSYGFWAFCHVAEAFLSCWRCLSVILMRPSCHVSRAFLSCCWGFPVTLLCPSCYFNGVFLACCWGLPVLLLRPSCHIAEAFLLCCLGLPSFMLLRPSCQVAGAFLSYWWGFFAILLGSFIFIMLLRPSRLVSEVFLACCWVLSPCLGMPVIFLRPSWHVAETFRLYCWEGYLSMLLMPSWQKITWILIVLCVVDWTKELCNSTMTHSYGVQQLRLLWNTNFCLLSISFGGSGFSDNS